MAPRRRRARRGAALGWVAVLAVGLLWGLRSARTAGTFVAGQCVDARTDGAGHIILHASCDGPHDGAVLAVLPTGSPCPDAGAWAFSASPSGGVACVQFQDPSLASAPPYHRPPFVDLGDVGLFLVITLGSVVLHELGHLVAIRAAGGDVVELSIGNGRRLAGVRIGTVDVNLRPQPTGAHVAWRDVTFDHIDRTHLLAAAGGLGVTLLLTMVAVVVQGATHSHLAAEVAWINGLLFVGNAAPVTLKGRASDGRRFLDAARGRAVPSPGALAEVVRRRRAAGDAERALAQGRALLAARAPAWQAAAGEALALHVLGRYDEAIAVLDRGAPAVAAAGATPRALYDNLLAHVLLTRALLGGPPDRVPEAMRLAETADAVLPRTAGGVHTVALARLVAGRDADAVRLCHWCLRRQLLPHTRASVLAILAVAFGRAGRRDAAEAALADAIAVGQDVAELRVASAVVRAAFDAGDWAPTGGIVMADNEDLSERLARIDSEIGEAKRRLSTLRHEGERHFIDDQQVDPQVTDALQRLIDEHERLNRLRLERIQGRTPPEPQSTNDLDAIEEQIRRLREAEKDRHLTERHFID